MYFPIDDDSENKMNFQIRSRRPKSFTLKLTSLIDMFTLILVFLLKSFSAEGEIMTLSDDLKLPESTSKKKPQVASIVAINHEHILLDGEIITETSRVLSLPLSARSIPELASALKTRRTLAEGLGELTDQMAFTGKINIQADQSIPYAIIKKVIMTCGSGGYNDIMLAVIEKE